MKTSKKDNSSVLRATIQEEYLGVWEEYNLDQVTRDKLLKSKRRFGIAQKDDN